MKASMAKYKLEVARIRISKHSKFHSSFRILAKVALASSRKISIEKTTPTCLEGCLEKLEIKGVLEVFIRPLQEIAMLPQHKPKTTLRHDR